MLPHTIRWQMRYLENLTSKTTLYFNSILLAKERKIVTNDDPERSLWKGLRIDYHDQYVQWIFDKYSLINNDTNAIC